MARPLPSRSPPSPAKVSPETPASSDRSAVDLVAIEVPLAAEPHEPIPHFVEVQLRSAEARAGLARLRDGAIAAGLRVGVRERTDAQPAEPGRLVQSAADALRALLEQLGRN